MEPTILILTLQAFKIAQSQVFLPEVRSQFQRMQTRSALRQKLQKVAGACGGEGREDLGCHPTPPGRQEITVWPEGAGENPVSPGKFVFPPKSSKVMNKKMMGFGMPAE